MIIAIDSCGHILFHTWVVNVTTCSILSTLYVLAMLTWLLGQTKYDIAVLIVYHFAHS